MGNATGVTIHPNNKITAAHEKSSAIVNDWMIHKEEKKGIHF